MGMTIIWESTRPLADMRSDSHGGYGFQTSWGSAAVAVELLEQALAKGSHPRGEVIV